MQTVTMTAEEWAVVRLALRELADRLPAGGEAFTVMAKSYHNVAKQTGYDDE